MRNNLLVTFVVVIFAGLISSSLLLNSNDVNKTNDLTFEEKGDLNVIGNKEYKGKFPISERKKKIEGYVDKDSPNLFAEWHNGIRTKPGHDRPDYPINYQIKELLKAKHVSNTQELGRLSPDAVLNWEERGPGNVAGRTRGILVDPTDPNFDTWVVGSVGGGVWKTTDAGQSWTHLTASLPNLATSALAWSISDPSTIYVGTGEGFGNVDQVDGSGIWKSTDGGATWNQLTSTSTNPEFENVMRMAVDPTTPDIIVAAVAPGFNYLSGTPSSGIWKSTDGGANWTKNYDAGNHNVEDLRADPTDFNNQYATVNATTVLKSTDAGDTWVESASGINLGAVSRMELAISELDPNVLYIAGEGGTNGSILYSSTDAGATWFAHEGIGDVNWLGAQGWYDNTIAVNPYDANQVFVGGIQLWQLDVSSTTDTSVAQITSIDQENLSSFFWFVNWGASFAGGGLDYGYNFFGSTYLNDTDYTSVEVRFGNGVTQKAHRFVYNAGNFEYQDYVDVPFEVWDIDHNVQLMASFRDHENNGTFDLNDRASSPGGIDREYTFINAVPYNATTPDDSIAQFNGALYKNTYAYWPEAPTGISNVDFNAINFDAVVRINYGTFITKGVTTTNITDSYGQYGGYSKGVHVDHHNIVLVKTDEVSESFRLVNGNDGGISFSDDKGATFSQTGLWLRGDPTGQNDVLIGYNTTQYYGIDKANGVDRYIGGMQDNGSWYSDVNPDATSSWIPAPSGDGYEASWHYNDVNKMMETSQFNSIYRSLDGGTNWEWLGGSVDYPNGPFFTKLGKSKQDPDLLFAISAAGVWRTDNFGSSWTLTTMPGGFNGTSSFSQLKISLVNPQIVWTARNMTASSPPYLSTDGGLTFNATNYFNDVALGRISGFETHPTDENTAFALLSMRGTPKVLKTTDLGQTWTELSGFGTGSTSTNGFPDVSVFSLLVMPYNTDIIWAGTEIGIFESTDGGATWADANNGFPSVSVYDMVIVNNEIVVGTHGRGVWSVELPELAGYEPPEATLAPRFGDITGGFAGMINARVNLPSAYDSTHLLIDGEVYQKLGANSGPSGSNFAITLPAAELYTVSLSIESFANGSTLKSPAYDVDILPLQDAQNSYVNDFNTTDDDFVSIGFTVGTPAGFDDGAVHSSHGYPNNADFTYTLTIPIIVASANALLSYDDVAIVEPGDPGAVYGDDNFWDYVIVEGSSDNGTSWVPLADGYDANYDATWLATYNASGAGDATMFVNHTLNLLDTFDAGDEVVIRFRLFADAFVNAWGWAIDNLNIQNVTGANDGDALPTVYSLSQNYPNPFNPSTTIKFALPEAAQVELKVYDVLGAEVATLMNQELQAGRYDVNWDASQLASGVYIYRIKAGDFVDSKKLMLLK